MDVKQISLARKVLEAQNAYDTARVNVSEGRATERERDAVSAAVERYAVALKAFNEYVPD